MSKLQSMKYKLRIESISSMPDLGSKARVSYIKQLGNYVSGRWGLANKKKPKIYILKYNKEIIYVGITKSALSGRFRMGLRAFGKNGYYGYKWKELAKKGESEDLDLFVYLFENEERTEAIEAEVVYLIRSKSNQWPKYQTEIHFHQSDGGERAVAEKIYNEINL